MTAGLVLTLLAFSGPDAFGVSADFGGGGGRLFTGSQASKWDCSVCHDRGTAGLEVRSTPDGLFTTGYTPGQTFDLEIELTQAMGKKSAFGLEANQRNGARAGTFSAVPAAELPAELRCTNGSGPVVTGDVGESAQSYACAVGLQRWRIRWTAPDTDVGSVTLYLAAVAGDGNGANDGDIAVAELIGVPSPSMAQVSSGGCSAAPVALALPLALLLLVPLARRRRLAVLVAFALVALPATGTAAPKKKRPPPPAAVEAPVAPAVAEPAAEPVATPPAAAAPAEPEPAPAPIEAAAPPPVVAPPAGAEVVTPEVTANAAAEPESAVEASAQLGFGLRQLQQRTPSFATPLRVNLAYPLAALDVAFFPFRLARVGALGNLEVRGRYVVGVVLGRLPLGAAVALPADGQVSVGYRIGGARLFVAPAVVYRVQVGGVEKNSVFDDTFNQSLGGELKLGVRAGRLELDLAPAGGATLDTGTSSVRGYGRSRDGFVVGGAARVGVQLGPRGLSLALRYQVSWAQLRFDGGGERALEALSQSDVTHSGALALTLER